jgi:hypothetical protein
MFEMFDAASLRAKAQRCREQAERVIEPDQRSRWLEIAQDFERAASELDRQVSER